MKQESKEGLLKFDRQLPYCSKSLGSIYDQIEHPEDFLYDSKLLQ